jgi:hypothetical protein
VDSDAPTDGGRADGLYAGEVYAGDDEPGEGLNCVADGSNPGDGSKPERTSGKFDAGGGIQHGRSAAQ